MANIYNYSKIKIDQGGVRRVVTRALRGLCHGGFFPKGSRKKPYEIRVIFVTPTKSAFLNKTYRKKNQATNVLSFDYGGEGEVVLCPEIIRQEARTAGNSIKFQTAWMIVHGLIHLAGIHHEQSRAQEKKATRLEERLLMEIGVRN